MGIRDDDNAAAAAAKTTNRVTLNGIKDRIEAVDYYRPPSAPHVTTAFVVMSNGFVIVGKSAPADPENFDPDLGARFAFEDALRQAWALLGFELCTKLSSPPSTPAAA